MRIPTGRLRRFDVFGLNAGKLLFGTLVFLGACATPPSAVPMSETLDVLPLSGRLDIQDLPPDWTVRGDVSPTQISGGRATGYPMIGVTSGTSAFLIARRTDAHLAVTPFLHWAWAVRAGTATVHPVRIVVGVRSRPQETEKRGVLAGLIATMRGNRALPSHDRLISILWGNSALQRGMVSPVSAAAEGRQQVQYTARGGRENAGSWWDDSVDLSRLFKETWPNDDILAARVVFIGVAAQSASASQTMSIGGLRLSR